MVVKNEVISVTICDSCGAEIRSGSLFCYGCGRRINGSEPTQQTLDRTVSKTTPEASGRNGASATVTDDPIIDSTSVPRQTMRATKRPEPQKIEVTWQRADRPGYTLLLLAVVVAAVVILMLAVASYIK